MGGRKAPSTRNQHMYFAALPMQYAPGSLMQRCPRTLNAADSANPPARKSARSSALWAPVTSLGMRQRGPERSAAVLNSPFTLQAAWLYMPTRCCEAGRNVCSIKRLDYGLPGAPDDVCPYSKGWPSYARCAALSRGQHADQEKAGFTLRFGLADLLFIHVLLVLKTPLHWLNGNGG